MVALHYMSKRCATCECKEKKREKGTEGVEDTEDENEYSSHTVNMCPRNYHGSSKGMECTGALASCLHLHAHHDVVYETIVMDDDSSTENILKWNMQKALDERLITELPTTASGGKKVDKGQLPFTHPPINRLADINHRNRCMAGKVYKLARLPKYKSDCTTADAERLKRNMNSALHQYKSHDFVTFKRMIWAVLYHHFDIHDTCGDWSRSTWFKNNEEELKKLHYRCKTKHSELYSQLLEIWEVYCTDESLQDVHHEWHTNKCESLNNFIAKFIPKCYHLCRSIAGKARTYLAVAIDSIGYESCYRSLLPLLQLDYDEDIMQKHHERLDKKRSTRYEYDKRPEVRRREAVVRSIKIRENIRREYEDKKAGKSYGSGCNDPSQKAKEKGDKKPASVNKKAICGFCGKMGHVTRRSQQCTLTTFKPKLKCGKSRPSNVTVPM